MTDIQILPGWRELVDSIDRQKGAVVILGAPDTGKTMLAFYLSWELQLRGRKVAIISADLGQSAFGLPATLGMAVLNNITISYQANRGPISIKNTKPHSIYFIGSTSPLGHLLQTAAGLKKLSEKAQGGGAEVLIIDTSGFVEGGAAWELKFHKIELVNARHIVAIQKEKELEDIVSPHEHRIYRTIHRLKIYEGIRPRSYEQRREYRREKFSEYFKRAIIKKIPLSEVRLINPVNINKEDGSGSPYKRLLAGLNDDENLTLGLGIIGDLGFKELHLLTPVEELKKVKIVRFGAIRLDDGWYDEKIS